MQYIVYLANLFSFVMRLQYVYTPYCSKHGLKGSTKIRQRVKEETAQLLGHFSKRWIWIWVQIETNPTSTYVATGPHCLRVFHICIAYQEKTEKEKTKQATFLLFRYYSATGIVIFMIRFSRKIIVFCNYEGN